ncbi:hypothetical protein [Halomontanus rarus]|uniref:hypothetical protein n=1 Tax=Halomontanus rarus TaxID=3034020 RepID=UPI0023E83964|nr:hypothetical protein [Halovivax sp. TS33]
MAASSPGPESDVTPIAHAHEVEPGCTLNRRAFVTGAAATGAAAIGTAATTGTVAANHDGETTLFDDPGAWSGKQVYRASQWLLGAGGDESETDTYETLERLGLWADATRTHLSHEAREFSQWTFAADFAEFSTANLYNEAAVAALEEYEAMEADDQSYTDTELKNAAIQAGDDRAAEILVDQERHLLNEAHHHFNNLQRLVSDAESITDLEPYELLSATGMTEQNDEIWVDVEAFTIADEGAMEYQLLDGSTLEKNAFYVESTILTDAGNSKTYNYAVLPTSSQNGPSATWVDDVGGNVSGDDAWTNAAWLWDPATTNPGEGPHDWPALDVAEFPQDEYDSLPEEEQDAIEPPEDVSAQPRTLCPQLYFNAWYGLSQLHADTVGEVETFLDGIWADLKNNEASEFLTGGMLATMSADEQTFPYAGGNLEALGLPNSEQTVTLEFPDADMEDWVAIEDGEDETQYNTTNSTYQEDVTVRPPRLVGNLYASSMPGSGFQVGNTYDPADLTPTIYFAYHVVNEDTGEQSSKIHDLDERFTVVEGRELVQDAETGEWTAVSVDQIDYSDSETATPPTDYSQLKADLDRITELEQKMAAEQQEIVVELEESGGGGFWPDLGSGGISSAIAGAVLMVGVVVAIAKAVTPG